MVGSAMLAIELSSTDMASAIATVSTAQTRCGMGSPSGRRPRARAGGGVAASGGGVMPLSTPGRRPMLAARQARWLNVRRSTSRGNPELRIGTGAAAPLTRRALLVSGAALALAGCGAGAPATSPGAPSPAGRGAGAEAIKGRLTVDLHSLAGRVNRASGDFEPLAEPMRAGGMAVVCLAFSADRPVTQVTPDKRIVAFRQPNPGELFQWSEAAFRRIHAIAREQR